MLACILCVCLHAWWDHLQLKCCWCCFIPARPWVPGFHQFAPHASYPVYSDGFMVGALEVGLRFCRPFLDKPDKKQGALQVGVWGRRRQQRCMCYVMWWRLVCACGTPLQQLVLRNLCMDCHSYANLHQRLFDPALLQALLPPAPCAAPGPLLLSEAAPPAGGRLARAQPGRWGCATGRLAVAVMQLPACHLQCWAGAMLGRRADYLWAVPAAGCITWKAAPRASACLPFAPACRCHAAGALSGGLSICQPRPAGQRGAALCGRDVLPHPGQCAVARGTGFYGFGAEISASPRCGTVLVGSAGNVGVGLVGCVAKSVPAGFAWIAGRA